MRWDDFVELVQMPSSLIIQIRGAYSEAKMHPPGWLGFANDERMSFVFLKMQFCYCSECLLNFLCPHDFVTFLPRSFAAISRGLMVEADATTWIVYAGFRIYREVVDFIYKILYP